MLIKLEDVGCKRCKSSDTKIEVLVPDKDVRRGSEGLYSTEIFCKQCGKINRTQLKIRFD